MHWTGERVILSEMTSDNPKERKRLDVIKRQHLARYGFALPFCADKSVLDAACGTGYAASILYDVCGTYYGYDISEETIKYAKVNSDLFICSIPVGNKSEFHKVVYSVLEIKEILESMFMSVDYFHQDDIFIEK